MIPVSTHKIHSDAKTTKSNSEYALYLDQWSIWSVIVLHLSEFSVIFLMMYVGSDRTPGCLPGADAVRALI